MPGRYIRDGYLDSERIASLTADGERFFFRVMLLADDYGRFSANPVILRNKAFPAHDDISVESVKKWLALCVKSGLLEIYSADGKDYLLIPRFGQKPGRRSKYPPPPENNGKQNFPDGKECSEIFSPNANANANANANISCSKEHSIETGLFDESENDTENEKATSIFNFNAFWDAYGKKIERVKCERIYEKIPESDRERIRERLGPYIASTPDLKFRKNPQTWLNGKCWNDEIITQEEKRNGTAGSYGRYIPKN